MTAWEWIGTIIVLSSWILGIIITLTVGKEDE